MPRKLTPIRFNEFQPRFFSLSNVETDNVGALLTSASLDVGVSTLRVILHGYRVVWQRFLA